MRWKLALSGISHKMASGMGSQSSTRISPRKFSEKIALLNKKEREANAKFEAIIKEVQATRSQPQQAVVDSTNSQCIVEELQSMIESTRSQAAHSDSLEEIEKVYENLMRCVAQCDPETSNQRLVKANKSCSQHQSNNCNRNECNLNIEPKITQAAAVSQSNGVAHPAIVSTTSMMNALISASPFYPLSSSSNEFQATDIDLNSNQSEAQSQPPHPQHISHNINFIPGELHMDTNQFSAHDMLNMRISSSYVPEIQQGTCALQGQTRGRVVSFGSASRPKYRCSTVVHQTDQLPDTIACDPNQVYELSQYPTQYLKEPSNDKSRQKSSSDPQLHMAPAHHSTMCVNACDNRQMIEAQAVADTQSTIRCCNMDQRQLHKAHEHDHQQYKQAYVIQRIRSSNNDDSRSSQDLQSSAHTHQHNQVLTTNHNLDCNHAQVSTTSQLDHQQHKFSLCDTTNTRGELPGIKICTIDDNDPSYTRMMMGGNVGSQSDIINTNEPSSHDSSLPDISNLQCGNNSAGASPERRVYHQQKNWPSQRDTFCSLSQINCSGMMTAQDTISDSCQALDGSWMAYECADGQDVSMGLQATNQPTSLQNRSHQLNEQDTSRWLDGSTNQQTLKTGNVLSDSDCGFSTSNNSHSQHGNLMICTSNDSYNNIFRSRSHSNIDYLAKHNAKRPHLYADNLSQFDEHHTSQYCLQSDQPTMNIRRIAELKAQGTSTSPLNSSSNLNSPQSEVNSPGSSTTEQCDSAMIFSTGVSQREYCPQGMMTGRDDTGSNSNEPQFVHYTLVSPDTLRQPLLVGTQQKSAAHYELSSRCVQIIEPQAQDKYVGQQKAPQAVLMCLSSSTTPVCSESSYSGLNPSPSSTTDSLAYISSKDNNQQID